MCCRQGLAAARKPIQTRWDVDDEELLDGARSLLLDLRRRSEAPASGTPS
jgi:hypothetical protein